MSYCLGCLACQTACPAGVNYAELFETARSDIERAGVNTGLSAADSGAALTLRLPLHASAGAARGGQAAAALSALRAGGAGAALGRDWAAAGEPAAARAAGAARWRAQFSNELIAAHEEPPASAARYRVALLTGCVQDLVYPDVNRDTADVLLANGCDVDTPPVQPCCGSLHAHNGDSDSAREPGAADDRPAAAGALRRDHQQRRRMRVAPAPLRAAARRRSGVRRARRRPWDRKLRDVHEWLGEIGCRAAASGAVRRAGHRDVSRVVSPGARAEGRRAQPRALLRLLPGVSVVELTESTWCCGSAGIYALTQPEQAERLLQRKVAHVLDDRRDDRRDRRTPAASCRLPEGCAIPAATSASSTRFRWSRRPTGGKPALPPESLHRGT